MIPNEDVLQSPITNYSQTGERRIEVPVGVSYADDLGEAAAVARRALERLPDRDEDEPVDEDLATMMSRVNGGESAEAG